MYEKIARYYDLVHAELVEDLPLVMALARQAGGTILELGCGTGRLLLPLARSGHQVIGLDNSPAMLARARAKVTAESEEVQSRVQLIEADMADFDIGEKIGLALIPYNTLLHLERPDMERMLQAVREHLVEDGRLFIDVVNPMLAAQTPDDRMLSLERVMSDPETGETVLQMASSWVDLQLQVLYITWLFDANPPEGGVVKRTVAQADYYFLYPHEIETMLKTAGFAVVEIYGDYERRPFDENSERLIILAA